MMLFEIMDLKNSQSNVFTEPIQVMNLLSFNPEGEDSFLNFAAHLYWRALKILPASIRKWWTESSDKQLRGAVEAFTEKYFSPLIINHQLSSIQEAETLKFDNMSIKPNLALKQVVATYSIEDVTIGVVVKLPNTFPLRQVEVEGIQRVGVSENQWRKWMLSMTTVIATQVPSPLFSFCVFLNK